ncbi:nuclease PA3 [Coniella lustricola]|uniref:Nuclease PA3 n=1 Tax=Coniella lustricola TaxID=2025994 RepID=A0A2T3A6J0_9PEZI|nr:nuclease PA3 [Coniella lustricola]
MRFSSLLTAGLLAVPEVAAWGGFAHITIAYIASNFVQPQTQAYFQHLLRSDDKPDYLASVATWADSIRYTKWGHYTGVYHFIDAKDDPPSTCSVDLARDCKAEGCVVTAIQNYTSQILDPEMPAWLRAQAAKFVVHFVGDIHQPLHDEDVARGGNGIHVQWHGRDYNLHHVWDSSIAEQWVGGVHRKPYAEAEKWAAELTNMIESGKFANESEAWLEGVDFEDQVGTALTWAREGNAYVCSHVFPEGPKAIVGQELSGEYYEKAAPVIEIQVARAGYRLAAWLDLIAAAAAAPKSLEQEL